ncbi:hypothetical protein [Candidatus Bathycorpusculum sp.]|uniref:hypothetical protein n=1 Tax=Candidatus Bathycorpusculum sp. TaxID=2994959 RepID=UPI002817B292|nr:hypothetical protein [Candidatus Termitimicrobium sp.]MCL2432732.1 hypothetical protein [Candidatus Termitimicrobium sp.]
MKKNALALSIIFLLSTLFLTSISFVQAAGEGQWITDYKIEDISTGQILVQYSAATDQLTGSGAVLPGAEVKITFTVNVIASGEGNLKLTSGLNKPSSGPYWAAPSKNDYDLGSAFSPNSQSTSFNWVTGEFEMILYGKVPTTSSASKALTAVSLYGPSGGTPLDTITITATSADMNNYLTLLAQKETKLESLKASGVDPGYIQIYQNVLKTSQDVANSGDVTNAIAMLRGLDVTNEPAGSTMQMLFLPLIIAAAVIAAIFAVLFLRLRGKVSYMTLVVEDQIKDLEGLTLRASKIDRAMSANLDSVKDRLKNLIGM